MKTEKELREFVLDELEQRDKKFVEWLKENKEKLYTEGKMFSWNDEIEPLWIIKDEKILEELREFELNFHVYRLEDKNIVGESIDKLDEAVYSLYEKIEEWENNDANEYVEVVCGNGNKKKIADDIDNFLTMIEDMDSEDEKEEQWEMIRDLTKALILKEDDETLLYWCNGIEPSLSKGKIVGKFELVKDKVFDYWTIEDVHCQIAIQPLDYYLEELKKKE